MNNPSPLIIVFFGPPGSGKGTQAIKLAEALSIPAISTGEILRKEIERKSKIGMEAAGYVNKGELVPDKTVVAMVESRINEADCAAGFIADGFPRNIVQASSFDLVIQPQKISAVFNLEVPSEILIKRIAGRLYCKKCKTVYNKYFKPTLKPGICDSCGSNEFESRTDDKEEVVRNRIKSYDEINKNVVTYYEKKGLLYSIDGLEPPEQISIKLLEIIRRIHSH